MYMKVNSVHLYIILSVLRLPPCILPMGSYMYVYIYFILCMYVYIFFIFKFYKIYPNLFLLLATFSYYLTEQLACAH